MSRYTADSRDRVFDAVDMVACPTAVELRRAGVNSYFGICPFHDERSGSFHVRPDEKHYHCFGCQASGDPFKFVMETEGLDFKAALESLADRFGVELETEDEDPAAAARRERRERLHRLLGRAAAYYARYLWEAREAAEAREYLLGRGLRRGDAARVPGRLRAERLGPDPVVSRRPASARRSCSPPASPALAPAPGRVYDRFRERIMFPAADARGRVRGFGAGDARRSGARRPAAPSTSTPPTASSTTSARCCSGSTWPARPAAKAGRMILVEGYTDVLALHQAGIPNAVGIMGTSLTEEQVESWRDRRHLSSCAWTPTAPARTRCWRGPGGRRPPGAARVSAARGHGSGRAGRSRGRRGGARPGSARCRSWCSRSSGSSARRHRQRRGTRPGPGRAGPVLAELGRACCATS